MERYSANESPSHGFAAHQLILESITCNSRAKVVLKGLNAAKTRTQVGSEYIAPIFPVHGDALRGMAIKAGGGARRRGPASKLEAGAGLVHSSKLNEET